MKNQGVQATAVEILNPEEESTLNYIKNCWEKNKARSSVKKIKDFLEKNFEYGSLEKARQTIVNLFRKGQILIDVKGRELLCRPNHVTVFSKTKPIDFRNITVIDQETDFPVSRIWFSIYNSDEGLYLNITESKRSSQGGWETANNILIPPEAISPYLELIKYINGRLEKKK